MRFLVDANLPRAVADVFAARGHTAEHVFELGLAHAPDRMLWRRAIDTGAVIVSKDEDFAALSRRDPGGARVVWLRTGNGSARALAAWLEPILPEIERRLAAGDRLVEVR